jgi:hypothetical protein
MLAAGEIIEKYRNDTLYPRSLLTKSANIVPYLRRSGFAQAGRGVQRSRNRLPPQPGDGRVAVPCRLLHTEAMLRQDRD